jgi:hypothetical protein
MKEEWYRSKSESAVEINFQSFSFDFQIISLGHAMLVETFLNLKRMKN